MHVYSTIVREYYGKRMNDLDHAPLARAPLHGWSRLHDVEGKRTRMNTRNIFHFQTHEHIY